MGKPKIERPNPTNGGAKPWNLNQGPLGVGSNQWLLAVVDFDLVDENRQVRVRFSRTGLEIHDEGFG
jgi:hypothetical protein